MTEIKYEELSKLDLLEKTNILVFKLFENKYDKTGEPYIEHLKFVSNYFNRLEYKVVGLLHDVLEDTTLTKKDLEKLKYPKEIIEAVSILTRKKNETYSSFIDRIIDSNNIMAIRVKKIDMTHNKSEERLKKLDKIEAQRLRNKYKNEYIKIEKYLEERNVYDRY